MKLNGKIRKGCPMKKKGLVILPFSIGFFIFLAAGGLAQESEYSSKFTKVVSAQGYKKINLDSRIGEIKIYGWDQEELRLEGVKKAQILLGGGRAENYIDDITVTLKQDEDEFSIKVRHPTGSIFERATYSVKLEIWIPREMEIEINNNIGEIKIEAMASSLRVRNNIGSIVVETDLPDEGRVSIRNNIGEISLGIPKDLSARISAQVNIGSVDVDSSFRGISSRDGFIGNEYDATIGEGGSRIDLSVNIGSIDISAK